MPDQREMAAMPRGLLGQRGVRIALAVAALAAMLSVWWFLPLADWTEGFRAFVARQGIWGYVLFAAAYALATVVLAPGSLLTLAAGVAFGLSGFFAVVVGATIGAGSAFLIGRHFARGWVERQTRGNRLFGAVDRAIEGEGWRIVALMRLSPLVPFILQNYFFGITKVGFWPYLVTTFFGIMPGTLLFVWIGSLGASAGMPGATGNAGLAKLAAYGVGLVATLAVTIIVSRKAQQKLKEAGVDSQPV